MTTRAFVYHNLQQGYPLRSTYATFLGEPIGRFRTVEPYPLVVPLEPTCFNKKCGFDHRICALLDRPGTGHLVEGEVYELDDDALRLLDIEERSYSDCPDDHLSSFRRPIELEPVGGGARLLAETHFCGPWQDAYDLMLEHGQAELVAHYSLEMAQGTPKRCCEESPGHPGDHDVYEVPHREC